MSARDKKILIILAGFVLLALSYFFVFQKNIEKKEALEAENTTLTARYNDLFEKASHEDEYRASIEKMNKEIEVALKGYPSFLQVENVIMDVVDFEDKTDSSIKSITIEDPVAMEIKSKDEAEASTEATGEASTETSNSTETTDTQATSTENPGTDENTAGQEDTKSVSTDKMQLYDMKTTIDFQCSTNNLKQFLGLVVNNKNKQSVNNLSVAYDKETGKLTCSLIYDAYFLYGLDKPYEEPKIPSMVHGLKDMFIGKTNK